MNAVAPIDEAKIEIKSKMSINDDKKLEEKAEDKQKKVEAEKDLKKVEKTAEEKHLANASEVEKIKKEVAEQVEKDLTIQFAKKEEEIIKRTKDELMAKIE